MQEQQRTASALPPPSALPEPSALPPPSPSTQPPAWVLSPQEGGAGRLEGEGERRVSYISEGMTYQKSGQQFYRI